MYLYVKVLADEATCEDASTLIEAATQRILTMNGVRGVSTVFTRDPEKLRAERKSISERLNQMHPGIGVPDLTRWLWVTADDKPAATAVQQELALEPSKFFVFSYDDLIGKSFVPKATFISWVRKRWIFFRIKRIRMLDQLWLLVSGNRDSLQSWRQTYLLSSPWGVGAVDVIGWPLMFRSTLLDRKVRVAVIDGSYDDSHADIRAIVKEGQVKKRIPSIGVDTGDNKRHGTATLGILFPPRDKRGLVGLAAGASPLFVYPNERRQSGDLYSSYVDAISRATDELNSGDILLVEKDLVPAGPPLELDWSCREAMRVATLKGITVVEPAGNGQKLLDLDPEPCGPPSDFVHSGAILVGASRPSTPEEALHGFTRKNYGPRVDVNAWGSNVYSAYEGPGPDEPIDMPSTYDYFDGTSAASAIVAGVAAVAACVYRALAPRCEKPDPRDSGIDPWDLRQRMVATGVPQHPLSATSEIGTQPNLPALLKSVRASLYAKYGIDTIECDERPDFTEHDHFLLNCVANGLDDPTIAEIMSIRFIPPVPDSSVSEPDVAAAIDEIARRFDLKSGPDFRLRLARIADDFGLTDVPRQHDA